MTYRRPSSLRRLFSRLHFSADQTAYGSRPSFRRLNSLRYISGPLRLTEIDSTAEDSEQPEDTRAKGIPSEGFGRIYRLATSRLERKPPAITLMRFGPSCRFKAALGAVIVSFLPLGVTLTISGGATITPLISTSASVVSRLPLMSSLPLSYDASFNLTAPGSPPLKSAVTGPLRFPWLSIKIALT